MSVASMSCCSRWSLEDHSSVFLLAPVEMLAITFTRFSDSIFAGDSAPRLRCWQHVNARILACPMQYSLKCHGPALKGHRLRRPLGVVCQSVSERVLSRRCCFGHACRAERMSLNILDAISYFLENRRWVVLPHSSVTRSRRMFSRSAIVSARLVMFQVSCTSRRHIFVR